MNLFNIFENDDNKPQDTRDSLTKTIDKLAARYPTTPVDKLAARYPDEEVKEWEDTAPGHDRKQTELTPVEEDFTGDTNYTYTVFIDGTKEGTYGSKEEAKAVVRRKKEVAPGRDYRIKPKARTSAASVRRFQKNRDRNIDEAEGKLKVSPHDAGMHAAVKGKPYASNPHPAGSKEHLEWSKGHNAMRARRAQDLDEHGGGGAGPREWHNYVRAHRTNEAAVNPQFINAQVTKILAGEVRRMTNAPMAQLLAPVMKEYNLTLQQIDSMVPGGLKRAAGEYGIMMKEGWSNKMVARRTGQAPTPYSVYIDGKEWKSFPDDDYAENVANKLRAKFKAEGRDPSVITIAATDYNKGMDEAYSKTPPNLELLQQLATQWQDGSDSAYDKIQQLGWNIADDRKGVYIIKQSDMSGRSKIYFPELTAEGSMADAKHHDTGPEFTGYWKGTDSATPGDKMVGGCEESAEPKGYAARVNELIRKGLSRSDAQGVADAEVKQGKLKEAAPQAPKARNFVAKNMKSAGAGQHKDAKRAMKQGDVKHKAKAIPMDMEEAMNVNDLLNKVTKDLNSDEFKNTPVDPNYKGWTGPKPGDQNYTKNFGHGYPDTPNNRSHDRYVNKSLKKDDVEEGAKVDRMQKHIAKSEKDLGHSKKDAEAIGWATLNKRGYLDNANKKKHNESVNFMEWAVAQGSRFNNFAGNPEVYAQAKAAYIAEGFGTSLANVSSKISGHPRKMKSAQQIRNKAMKFKPQPIAETDVEEDYVSEIKKGQKDSNGNSTCWSGYHAAGTKPGKNGPVRNCVKNENVEEDWQKANKKDKTDGMSQKAVNAYKREHPGSKLKTAVTTKPSKLKKGSKASKRRSSYCSRSKGQMKMHSISCAKTPDKAICKARKRWNCEGVENLDAMLAEAIEKGGDLQPGQYYIWTVYFDDGSKKRIKVTKENFDPKAYYAKKNQVVINTEYDWTVHNG